MIKRVAIPSDLGKGGTNCVTASDVGFQKFGLTLQMSALCAHAFHAFAGRLPENEYQTQVRQKQNSQRAENHLFPSTPGTFRVHVVSYHAVSSSVILSAAAVIWSS